MTAPKRALITGAGSGLGLAMAKQWAERGWHIACVDIDGARAQEAASALTGGGHLALTADIAESADWDALVEQIDASWGSLNLLVNNAGVSSGGTVADTPLEDWDWMLKINLTGVFLGCRAFVPMLTRSAAAGESAHVVNVASFAGLAMAPGMAAYNVAKAGVIALSESLRAEVAPQNINVSVVCPAFFKTRLLETFRAPGGDAADAQKSMVATFMARSKVTADDVAADVIDAVARSKFMVITHKGARKQALMKRIAPELYFRKLVQATQGFAKGRG